MQGILFRPSSSSGGTVSFSIIENAGEQYPRFMYSTDMKANTSKSKLLRRFLLNQKVYYMPEIWNGHYGRISYPYGYFSADEYDERILKNAMLIPGTDRQFWRALEDFSGDKKAFTEELEREAVAYTLARSVWWKWPRNGYERDTVVVVENAATSTSFTVQRTPIQI